MSDANAEMRERIAAEVAHAIGGFCPARHHGRTPECINDEIIIYPHEPVVMDDGAPELAILPGHVYYCRHCRALYCPETVGEWSRRMRDG